MKSKVRKFEFGVRILDGTRGTNGMDLGMTRPDGSRMRLPEEKEIRAAHDLHGPWLCHFSIEHDHLADEFVRRWNAHEELLKALDHSYRALTGLLKSRGERARIDAELAKSACNAAVAKTTE